MYCIFLFKNIGEESSILFGNKRLISIIIFFLIIVIAIFIKDSGITDHEEYDSILEKHYEIRENILTIKKNIPILSTKLQQDPSYYQGWVMLAKSYIITNQLADASMAYQKALSLDASEPIILEEYISVLRKLDPKSNKDQILKYFDKLLVLDSDNLNIYNMKLNYSIDINDGELTKEILDEIVSNPEITNKDQYIAALKNIELSGEFTLKVMISDLIYKSLSGYNYVFFILKEDNSKVPFAVKKFSRVDLSSNLILNSNNKMIKNTYIPKKVRLYIKGTDKPGVTDSMKEIHKSDILELSKLDKYVIN